MQRCHNCGTEFADNFCPRCGQRAGVGRVGWSSISDNIAILWGLDSRSLFYTLVQLIGRPGYLVRDYISGRRQVSFPPVNMLVLVTFFIVIVESVFHLEDDVLDFELGIPQIGEVVAWVNSQKSWATLLLQSLLILPTWLVFRYAPDYPRHTLPEGFFLQVFLSIQTLILSFLDHWAATFSTVLAFVWMYITYRQLFGYRRWGTLWRVIVLWLSQLMSMAAIYTFGLSYKVWISSEQTIDFGSGSLSRLTMLKYFLIILAATVVLMAVMLLVTHRINKRSYRNSLGNRHLSGQPLPLSS